MNLIYLKKDAAEETIEDTTDFKEETEETKEELRSIAPFWENNNLRSKGGALLPDEVSVYMETGFFGMEGKLNSGDAHLAVDYQQVLQKGLKGYEEKSHSM